MRYFQTPKGVIFNEENTIIEPNDSNLLWLEYISFLANEGTLEYVDYELEETLEVPSEVALWKLRFILKQMDLEDIISEKLNELPEPQKTKANYIWNYGNSIDRYSPTILYLQNVLSLSNHQVNMIFINANSITL